MDDRQSLFGTQVRCWSMALLTGVVCSAVSGRALAQSPAIEPASYQRDVARAQPQAIRFARRQPQVGDQTVQNITVNLELKTMVRQAGEVLERTAMNIRRQQQREVIAAEIDAGRAMAATIHYFDAAKQVSTGQTATELTEGPVVAQPVAGMTYHCRRVGDELNITDPDGNTPPLDQYEIVALNMESLGRANPLAKFLAGRTVRVGEKLELPNELADRLLGLGDTLGHVSRFTLTLQRVETVAAGQRGVFHASVDAASNDSSQMRLALEGPLVIDTATSRPVNAKLAGPIGMSETRGSLTETYQLIGTGRMAIRIASNYDDAAR